MASATEELSADEIALYDRQLRLWGIEAQNRMRKAKVLLITIKALGNEIAKNLVLAGIGSLTVLDPGTVSEADVASQFLVSEADIGKNVVVC
jgi:ubiquitin-like 1-activating enzyme E1 A